VFLEFMGLNNIELTAASLADLYPTSLVQMGDTATTLVPRVEATVIAEEKKSSVLPAIEENNWKSLGDNQQRILIVVDYSTAVHLPDEELAFLTTMLTACKLNLGDVAIINMKNYKMQSGNDILAHFTSKTVLLLGIEPLAFGLPVSFPHFQVQAVAASTYLFAPVLEEIRTDKLLKSKLWVSLQRIFDL
jgi:hypothetical protein